MMLRLGIESLRNAPFPRRGGQVEPAVVIWVLGNRCIFRCRHCRSWHDSHPGEPAAIMHIAREIARSRCRMVVLSGGEPLLVPNLYQVIALLKSAGKFVSLNTNGYLLEQHARTLLKLGVNAVTVSLDSVEPAVHDAIRVHQGAFDGALRGLRRLHSARRGSRPRLVVRGVIMKDNLDSLHGYVDAFKHVADDIGLQPIHDHEKTSAHQVTEPATLLDPSDEARVRQLVGSLTRQYPELDNGFYRNIPRFLFHPEQMERLALEHCFPILLMALSVNADGSCWSCTREIGNLLSQGVPDVWSSESRRGFLNDLLERGTCRHPCWLHSSVLSSPWPGRLLLKALRSGGR